MKNRPARSALPVTPFAQQHSQALVGDVVDHPSAIRNSASLDRLQVENCRPCSAGLDLAAFLISRCAGMNGASMVVWAGKAAVPTIHGWMSNSLAYPE